METEIQRRHRVVGRIKQDLADSLGADLITLAEAGAFPRAWLGARELNRILDDAGYWLRHPNPMAAFVGPEACARLVEKALAEITSRDAHAWWRDGDRFRATNADWQAQALDTANRLSRECPGADRTALYGGSDEASVIFGSDCGVSDPAARSQINLLREFLCSSGISELAFAISDRGHTWVMLVWSRSESLLQEALFAAWQAGVGV